MKLPSGVQEFFKRSGKKGGQTRAKKLSAKVRKQIAQKAARARWSKKKDKGLK